MTAVTALSRSNVKQHSLWLRTAPILAVLVASLAMTTTADARPNGKRCGVEKNQRSSFVIKFDSRNERFGRRGYSAGLRFGFKIGFGDGFDDGRRFNRFCDQPRRLPHKRSRAFRQGYRQGYSEAYGKGYRKGRWSSRGNRRGHRRH